MEDGAHALPCLGDQIPFDKRVVDHRENTIGEFQTGHVADHPATVEFAEAGLQGKEQQVLQ